MLRSVVSRLGRGVVHRATGGGVVHSAAAGRQTTTCWMSTLVIAEPNQMAVSSSAVNAAQQLRPDEDVILLHVSSQPLDKDPKVPAGVSKVYTLQQPPLPETIGRAVSHLFENDTDITAVMTAGTKFGNSVLPRLGAILQSSPLSDVLQILDKNTFIRPLYAGNVLCKVEAETDENIPVVLSIRPTAFDALPCTENSKVVQEITEDVVPAGTEWISEHTTSSSESGRPDLQAATNVVSGGRGLGDGQHFSLLENLADSIGNCAVGASRAAVDAGMCPNDMQVGQTGKVVAPNLYIAVGISGAIQHLSGMKDSKTIVAINKDSEAPIFEVADYGLVGDLFDVVPELTEKLK